jgi:hypothetical protein
MVKRLSILSVLVATLTLVMLASAAPVNASNLTIRVTDGTTTFTCTDLDACDHADILGSLSFNSPFGPVSVTNVGTGNPQVPLFNMDLGYVVSNGGSSATGSYTVWVSQNGLSGTIPAWTGLINGNQQTGNTTSWAAYADAGNTLFATTTLLCSGGPLTSAAVAGICNGGFAGGTNFSLTEMVTVTSSGASGVASGDFSMTTVPEPSSMLMLGTGLFGLAGMVRRRMKK